MARYTGPKSRIARRFGEPIFEKRRPSWRRVSMISWALTPTVRGLWSGT